MRPRRWLNSSHALLRPSLRAKRSNPSFTTVRKNGLLRFAMTARAMDCFAEFIIARAFARPVGSTHLRVTGLFNRSRNRFPYSAFAKAFLAFRRIDFVARLRRLRHLLH